MSRKISSYPCICGHSRNKHLGYTGISDPQCLVCFDLEEDGYDVFPMHEYQSDNLKYLENEYEKKRKV
jgi:hypothetical protein